MPAARAASFCPTCVTSDDDYDNFASTVLAKQFHRAHHPVQRHRRWRSSGRSTSASRPGSPGRRRSIGRATGCGCGGARQEHGAVGKAPFLHALDAGLWYAVVEWRSVGDAPGAGSGGPRSRRSTGGRVGGLAAAGARQRFRSVGAVLRHGEDHETGAQPVHREVLALTWATGYTRPRMGTDAIQPSHRRPVMHPTTRLPDYPTTRLPDYPTTRLPRAASLSANPVAADRSAPVLTAAPSIRVAHTRRAAVPRTADHVCRDRDRHQSTPAGAAGSKKQTGYVRPPPRVACARERRHGIKD